jgi:transposase
MGASARLVKGLLMPPMSKVELYAAIRRDARAGSSGRAIEVKYRVSRQTVAKALASAWPQPRKPLPARPSKLDAFKPVIDVILRTDLDAPRKQRHTAKRIFDRLITEHAMADVSYPVVRRYVRERAAQIRVESGRAPVEAFIPQTHRPGAEAEVDFGEVMVNLRGEPVTCMLFSFRMSYSGKAVHRIFATGGQEAFLEGHVHALAVLGGVPTGQVRYDNLRSAVARVLGFSRQRVETARWTAFRSHVGLDVFYCQTGLRGAHEKGGVEGQIGWFRRNHLVPTSTRSNNSTPWSTSGTRPMTPGASANAPAPSVSTSRSNNRCSNRCPRMSSRQAPGSHPASTATARSPSARTATRCQSG